MRGKNAGLGRSRVGVFEVLGGDVFALRQLEHVLDAVHHLESAPGRQLPHVPSVEEPVLVCALARIDTPHQSGPFEWLANIVSSEF